MAAFYTARPSNCFCLPPHALFAPPSGICSPACHRFVCIAGRPGVLHAAEPREKGTQPAAKRAEQAAEQSAEQNSPFFKQRRAVVDAAKASRWDDAIAQARKLVDMTQPQGNPYEQLDASELLYTLLYQQGQYAQAVLQTDQMMQLAATDDMGPVNGQMQALVQRGLMAAVMADDKAALARYLQALKQEAKPFAPLWQWDAQRNQLSYQAAQFSVPLVQGRWVLFQLEPAKDRKDAASLQYVYLKPDGKRLLARVQISDEERLKDMDAVARQKWLKDDNAYLRELLSDDGVLTVNLFGRSSSYESSVAKLAEAFGEEALWAFKPTREGNTIVLAQRTPMHPTRAELLARAEDIKTRWDLPAPKWLKVFKPVKVPA